MNIINNYGPAAIIMFGYIVAAYWQAKRFDDLKDLLLARIDKVEGVLAVKLDALTGRVKALEDEIHSPLVKR